MTLRASAGDRTRVRGLGPALEYKAADELVALGVLMTVRVLVAVDVLMVAGVLVVASVLVGALGAQGFGSLSRVGNSQSQV